MRYKIVIPKSGKDAGVVKIEGMEQNANCMVELEKVAVGFGPIKSVERKDHFDDDAPLFENVHSQE